MVLVVWAASDCSLSPVRTVPCTTNCTTHQHPPPLNHSHLWAVWHGWAWGHVSLAALRLSQRQSSLSSRTPLPLAHSNYSIRADCLSPRPLRLHGPDEAHLPRVRMAGTQTSGHLTFCFFSGHCRGAGHSPPTLVTCTLHPRKSIQSSVHRNAHLACRGN